MATLSELMPINAKATGSNAYAEPRLSGPILPKYFALEKAFQSLMSVHYRDPRQTPNKAFQPIIEPV